MMSIPPPSQRPPQILLSELCYPSYSNYCHVLQVSQKFISLPVTLYLTFVILPDVNGRDCFNDNKLSTLSNNII